MSVFSFFASKAFYLQLSSNTHFFYHSFFPRCQRYLGLLLTSKLGVCTVQCSALSPCVPTEPSISSYDHSPSIFLKLPWLCCPKNGTTLKSLLQHPVFSSPTLVLPTTQQVFCFIKTFSAVPVPPSHYPSSPSCLHVSP